MSPSSTQEHLKIASIEEGVTILKDGSLSVVLRVFPINFDLKNELEQNGIIAKYQNFLNSLEFPIQIVIRSKRLDLEPYLAELERKSGEIFNELLQIQSSDYISFMRSLVQVANIMSKEYYLVLTYKRVDAGTAKSGLLGMFSHSSGAAGISRTQFDQIRSELNNHANTIASGLSQIGLRVEALDTQNLIELFYTLYNPDISTSERLVKMENIQTDVVTGSQNSVIGGQPAPAGTEAGEGGADQSAETGQPANAEGEPNPADKITLATGDESFSQIGVAEAPAVIESSDSQSTASPSEPVAPPVPPVEPEQSAPAPVPAAPDLSAEASAKAEPQPTAPVPPATPEPQPPAPPAPTDNLPPAPPYNSNPQ